MTAKENPPHSSLAQADAAVQAVCEKYLSDLLHGRHVAHLAEALFDAFLPLHGLGAEERQLLRHAALVHDIGYFVAAERHHRHGEYLVRSDARLRDYPAPERDLLARVVRNHRKKAEPGPSDWPKARRIALLWLSGLLRAADALDYDHRQQAEIAGVRGRGQGFEILIRGLDPETLGVRLGEKAHLLEQLLGGPVRFRHGVS